MLMRRTEIILPLLFVAVFLIHLSVLNNLITKSEANYYRVTINLIGSGTLAVRLPNNTVLNINSSTSFLVPGKTAINITSNQSFMVNNDYVITKDYVIGIIQDTTLNVDFLVEDITLPPTIALELSGTGNLNVEIINDTAILTYFTINKTTSFFAPAKSLIIIYSPSSFYVNGKIANHTPLDYFYMFNVTGDTTLQIAMQQNITTITHYPSEKTVTSLPSSNVLPSAIILLFMLFLLVLFFIVIIRRRTK